MMLLTETLLFSLVLFLNGQAFVWGAQTNIEFGGDGVISMSLQFYNPKNQSIWTIHTLEPRSLNTVSVTKPPSDVKFYIFQAHAFLHNISLSYNQTFIPHYHVNGTNLGLVWETKLGPSNFYILNRNPENVTVMYAVVAYGSYSPVPGGCNMEFEIETAPYLKVSYNDAMVEVNAQPALAPGLPCTRDVVTHDMYHMYMPPKDFSADSYFAAIRSMLTPQDIIANGSLAPVPIYGSSMRRLYSLYAGTGSVYVTLAKSLVGVSAYVPAITYGCSAIYFTDSCSVLTTTFSKVLIACVLFGGFFTCLYGHSFFRTHLSLAGFLCGGLLAYVALVQSTTISFEWDIALACLVGLGVGAACILLWMLRGIPMAAILLLATPLGFLFASLAFYVGLADMQFAQLDSNFWLAFVTLVLCALLCLLPLQQHACMASCAALGAYAVVVPFDHYTGGNLKYIAINSVRRATVPGFNLAVVSPPFWAADGLVSALWLLLAVIGLRVQQLRQRGRPPFPPATRAAPPPGLPRPAGARTPLRVSSRVPRGYGSMGDDDVFETPPGAARASARSAVAAWLARGVQGARGLLRPRGRRAEAAQPLRT